MRIFSLSALLLGFTASAAETEPAPTPSQELLYRALSMRDQSPPCVELEALSTDPMGDLTYIVDHAQQPPWAAMRAAACLISGHAEAAAPMMKGWMVDPEKAGLAILVLGRLDDMPLAVGVELATAALSGPDPDGARKRIARASAPEIRRLAE